MTRLSLSALSGREQAHPEDSAWDGDSFTHRWYNTGRESL